MANQEYATFNEAITFDLFEKWDTDEQARKGSVKTYRADPNSGLIYDSRKSDYFVTVERVLAVDGHENTLGDNSREGQRMSLVILKIVVACHKPEFRVRAVAATLTLKNSKTGPKVNPILEAWAPFRRLQLTDPQRMIHRQMDKKKASVGASFYGTEARAELIHEKEIAFEQIYYDTASAAPVMDHHTKQRAGVTWYMEQSRIQTKGVPPELFAAVLFTRETDDDYFMGFDIDVYGGTTYDFRNKVKRIFGLKPGHTKPFLVKPSRDPVVRGGEGRDFLRSVRSDNLGSLRATDDSTGLNIARRVEAAAAEGGEDTGGEPEQGADLDEGG
ncbi:hypothetical protein EKO27_g8323 [Xylaria grammica]|uniref:Uncharacterized protein n=1 Tax=Xylaria grammica TaxID=363999 RepID=A0A439CX37_9PEZI|nr:hypothetical protein EKO27_g8323 [Xylaria grammica]